MVNLNPFVGLWHKPWRFFHIWTKIMISLWNIDFYAASSRKPWGFFWWNRHTEIDTESRNHGDLSTKLMFFEKNMIWWDFRGIWEKYTQYCKRWYRHNGKLKVHDMCGIFLLYDILDKATRNTYRISTSFVRVSEYRGRIVLFISMAHCDIYDTLW